MVETMRPKSAAKALMISGAVLVLFLIAVPAYLITYPPIPGDETLLTLLYGPDTPLQVSIDGKIPYILEELSETEKARFQYAQQVETQIFFKARGWNGDPQSLIVLTQTGPPDCCSTAMTNFLGGAVVERQKGAWHVRTYQKFITPFEGFDLDPNGELIQIKPFPQTGVLLQDHLTKDNLLENVVLIIGEVDGILQLIHSRDKISPGNG